MNVRRIITYNLPYKILLLIQYKRVKEMVSSLGEGVYRKKLPMPDSSRRKIRLYYRPGKLHFKS